MKLRGAFVFAAACFAALGAAKPSLDCYGGGGGGPTPFIDITGALVQNKRVMNTGGSVADYLYLQGFGALISRTDAGELMATDVDTNRPYRIGKMDMSLSRMVHPKERFLVSDGNTYLFDLQTKNWKHFTGPTGPIEHLFWWTPPGLHFRPSLYSLGAPVRENGKQQYRLYGLNPQVSTTRYCTVEMSSDFRLVRGTTQPFVVFFKDQPAREGREVTFRFYRATNCTLAQEGVLRLPDMPAAVPLEGAYYMSQQRAAALKFDYAKKNLVWVKWSQLTPVDNDFPPETMREADGCKFYSVENGAPPVFLSDSEPIMASWGGARNGLQMYYLHKGKKARLLADVSLSDVDPRSLWLSRDGEKLFVAPTTGRGREITELSLRAP